MKYKKRILSYKARRGVVVEVKRKIPQLQGLVVQRQYKRLLSARLKVRILPGSLYGPLARLGIAQAFNLL